MTGALILGGLLSAAFFSFVGGVQPVMENSHTIVTENAQPQQTLIICNAYTSDGALDVINARSQQKLTELKPLAYKSCSAFTAPLQEGDQMEFEVGKRNVGTFLAKGLPDTDSSLLLVPYKKHGDNTKASFASHKFSDLHSSQIVVVDTFAGSTEGKVKIMDANGPTQQESGSPQETATALRAEDLRFNSVVAVNAGRYQVMLNDGSGNRVSQNSLQVEQGKANYVVMRVGGDGRNGNTTQIGFPQELVVYPPANSGTLAARLHLVALLGCLSLGSVFAM